MSYDCKDVYFQQGTTIFINNAGPSKCHQSHNYDLQSLHRKNSQIITHLIHFIYCYELPKLKNPLRK